MLRVVDRQPWVLPVGTLVLVTAAASLAPLLGIYASFTSGPLRQQVYTSLAGTSSALLGFLIAAVTILAAFGRRPTSTLADQQREESLARARTRLVGALLAAALCMLAVLVASTLALSASNHPGRLVFADALIIGGSSGGFFGILYGGFGLGLAVAERAR